MTALILVTWSIRLSPPFSYDAPYVPSPAPVVEEMLRLAEVSSDDVVFDLGSGDGRVLIAAAQRRGARAVGVELDAALARISREKVEAAGLGGRVDVRREDLFTTDLSSASVVTLYLLPAANRRLRPRLAALLRPGSRVVSHRWGMDEWRPDREVVVGGNPPAVVRLWVVPAGIGGVWSVSIDPQRPRSDPSRWHADPSGQRPDPRGQSQDGSGHQAGPLARGFELSLMQRFQDLFGTARVGDRRVAVVGRVEGDRCVIELVLHVGPGRIAATLNGRLADGRLEGFVELGDEPVRLGFTGERHQGAAEGEWEWRQKDGDRVVLSVRRKAAVWLASWYEETEVIPLDDFYVWGSSLYFTRAGTGGTPGRAYQAVIDGPLLRGTMRDSTLRRSPWSAGRRRER